MPFTASLIEFALGYSEALSTTAVGLYLLYEVRLGVIKETRENQRTLGVGLYRVIERDEELDEAVFREEMWNESEEEGLLARDLTADDEEGGD